MWNQAKSWRSKEKNEPIKRISSKKLNTDADELVSPQRLQLDSIYQEPVHEHTPVNRLQPIFDEAEVTPNSIKKNDNESEVEAEDYQVPEDLGCDYGSPVKFPSSGKEWNRVKTMGHLNNLGSQY